MTASPASAPLARRLAAAPLPRRPDEARARVEGWLAEQEGKTASALKKRLGEKPVRALLEGIADGSPYLWRLIESDAARCLRLLAEDPAATIETISARLAALGLSSDVEEVMRGLRLAKQEAALVIALADLGGVWDAVDVTYALSRFADDAVGCALSHLLREADGAGKIALPDRDNPPQGCGLVILALGKHGAKELNYSSDVDLVVFFDPETQAVPDGGAMGVFVRIVRNLVKLLQERTQDGYVVRVDLRLRPDPGSTQVAVSLPAALSYYETLGQNWERAAFIKARAIAGDVALGEAFLKELTPFIWRKYFDYAAIADVHAMKRQIHAVRGHAEVVVPGHDVKLGRGGIREIEFFVQTQQLIFGGRRPQLRGRRTLDMLEALQADGWVTAEAVTTLSEAYKFLRGVEHRLQMIADEQTQRLPAEPEPLRDFALFCGYATTEDFAEAITTRFRAVEAEYARLFEHAPGLDTAGGSLVFTGVSDDPETMDTLRGMGFRDPAAAAETVRGWHFGRRAAVRSARAREVLTELIPGLLEAFSGSGDPDAALAAFDAALARMPAAIELFSILRSNAAVRELFGDILGGAPHLASVVAARPHVLDAAIGADLVAPGDLGQAFVERLRASLATVTDFEAFLDQARYLAQDEMFLIGARMFSAGIEPGQGALAYSLLAETILAATFDAVAREFATQHGVVKGGRAVVVALGKLGSREMTATSDLDLMLIYDFDEATPDSDGPRGLHAVQYYTRLTQRLVSALTSPTRAGLLYDVDMRLRPSGNKGPVATQLSAFRAYQSEEAETWEKMSMTRARVVAGDESLARDVDAALGEAVVTARGNVLKDVRDMRALIAKEKGDADPWNLKLAKGGLLDVEFVAQALALRHGAEHPELRAVGTAAVLREAARLGLLSPRCVDVLLDGHRLLSDVTQLTRVSVGSDFRPETAPEGVKRRIAAALGLPDIAALAADLDERRAAVRACFIEVLKG
jgi:glutamate-ammonia-ligase adenylyltransferase